MKFEYQIGATPLDPDETEGLIPGHIATQKQLNEWEAANILEAEKWLFSNKHDEELLSLEFTTKLHKKMFSDTWRWAGTFRKTEKSIGITPMYITTELKNLLEDTSYQIQHQIHSIDEIAYRFHHRLVKIHPFPNGNGRHARLMTDFLLIQTGHSRFSWGRQAALNTASPVRKQYIEALRQADKFNYEPLATFVRS